MVNQDKLNSDYVSSRVITFTRSDPDSTSELAAFEAIAPIDNKPSGPRVDLGRLDSELFGHLSVDCVAWSFVRTITG